MFSSERDELRKQFFSAWQKHLANAPVEPLEAQIIQVILLHPEYHEILSHPEKYQLKDFGSENPFLHMSLHLALREQIATDRPRGIRGIYANLLRRADVMTVEHQMMGCLERILWESQRLGVAPDEQVYFGYLKEL